MNIIFDRIVKESDDDGIVCLMESLVDELDHLNCEHGQQIEVVIRVLDKDDDEYDHSLNESE